MASRFLQSADVSGRMGPHGGCWAVHEYIQEETFGHLTEITAACVVPSWAESPQSSTVHRTYQQDRCLAVAQYDGTNVSQELWDKALCSPGTLTHTLRRPEQRQESSGKRQIMSPYRLHLHHYVCPNLIWYRWENARGTGASIGPGTNVFKMKNSIQTHQHA